MRKRGRSRRRPSARSSTSACARAAETAARNPRVCRCSRYRPSSGARPGSTRARATSTMSCIKGDCPSFLLVERGDPPRTGGRSAPPEDLPEPTLRVPEDALIRMPGVGGTGVVTAAAILRTAAHLEGRYAAALDQTGLAQKGGPVVSDLRLASAPDQWPGPGQPRRRRRPDRLRSAGDRHAPDDRGAGRRGGRWRS